ncbi:thioesterase [Loktanella sp. IMCC34160]|uniref:thioesterase family protein n=1 Tax=Loktanella sp. IMCC34160 TaxID=2510646 RepID=UPI00101CF898|nr:thioesterase family protein [Loktanella sp. IMCC34160]RYG89294.1 thioesterase [Loktanella sp. IMCC34160]
MTTTFRYQTTVRPEWIDYNGHMQDAFYGLIFSYAVDAFQDAVGFDGAYRDRTGCTIYLLEDHKFFLREVREGALVEVETVLLDFNEKRFHLWSAMKEAGELVAISEMVEMHVQQSPQPHGVAMPRAHLDRLAAARMAAADVAAMPRRSRGLGI